MGVLPENGFLPPAGPFPAPRDTLEAVEPTLQALYRSEDYRLFLREYFREQKRLRKAFSHRWFARQAGFESSGFLAHVMAGERNLTEASARKIGKAIGLKGAALGFLEALVLFNQAKDPEVKIQRWKSLEKLRAQPGPGKMDGGTAAEYFRLWHTPAVRELAVHADWQGDPGRLGAMLSPPISAEKAAESLRTLVDLGLLRREPDGGYTQSSGSLTTEGAPLKARRGYRLEMMFRAIEAMDNLGPDARHLSGLTVAMSGKSFAEVSVLMDELRRKALELAQRDEEVERVYQFNFQGFPLSAPIRAAGKKAKARK